MSNWLLLTVAAAALLFLLFLPAIVLRCAAHVATLGNEYQPLADSAADLERLAGVLDERCAPHRADASVAGGAQCAVCLGEMLRSELVRTLPCPSAMPEGHSFHRECIDRWLLTRRTCPLCSADCSQLCRRLPGFGPRGTDSASRRTTSMRGPHNSHVALLS